MRIATAISAPARERPARLERTYEGIDIGVSVPYAMPSTHSCPPIIALERLHGNLEESVRMTFLI